MRVLGARQRSHRKAVRERREVLLELVRRPACWDEMDFIEIETAVGGAGHCKVAVMNRVKGAAEQRDATRLMLCGGAMRLRCRQRASQEEPVVNFLTNS
jgi:hypothetical protein